MQQPAISVPFTGSRVRFMHTQVYRAALGDMFPLLCPVREYDYLPQWQCRIVRLDSGLIEEGGVFTTEDGGDVWVVARYIPNESIRFIRVNAWRTMSYSIDVQPAPPGEVRLRWEQVITGLNPEGNEQVAALQEVDFVRMLDELQRLLQHYLDTSPMLRDG